MTVGDTDEPKRVSATFGNFRRGWRRCFLNHVIDD